MYSNKKNMRQILILIGLFIGTYQAVLCQDIFVSPSGDNANDGLTVATAKQSINVAIAAVGNGDTVLVQPGTYTENILVNRTCTIKGTDSATCIIDPPNGVGINLQSSNVLLRNITIKGGTSGISNTQTTMIENVILERVQCMNNSVQGVIFGSDSQSKNWTIRESRFNNNGSIGFGNNTGVAVDSLRKFTFIDCEFAGNGSNGLSISGHQSKTNAGQRISEINLTNCVFSSNGTPVVGSGDILFFRFSGSATLTNVTVQNGTGNYGMQIKGWNNGGSGCSYINSFTPAGTMTFNNVSISGNYSRTGSSQMESGCVVVHGFSNVNNVTFNTCTFESFTGGSQKACILFNEIGTGCILNNGPTTAASDMMMNNCTFKINGNNPINRFVNIATVSGINAEAGATFFIDRVNVVDPSSIDGYVYDKLDNPIIGKFKYLATPFALDMLQFTARTINGKIRLNWQTSQEQYTSHFEIERIVNWTEESNWEKIGSVVSQNRYDISNYYYTDITPHNSKHLFYRIKQVDQDGSFHYSRVVQVTNNPSYISGKVWSTEQKICLENTSGQIRIIKLDGQVVLDQNLEDVSYQEIPTSLTGVYVVQVIQNWKVSTYKMLLYSTH